jgi:hypothetical protein
VTLGAAFSGDHAFLMGMSSIVAVIMTWRFDVNLMSCKTEEIGHYFTTGIASVGLFFLASIAALWAISTQFIILKIFLVLACACFAALIEMSSAFYVREGRNLSFAILKSSPFALIALVAPAIEGSSLEKVWLSCLAIPAIVATSNVIMLSGRGKFKSDLYKSLSSLGWRLNKNLLYVLGALVAAAAGNFMVIVIHQTHGSEFSGVWINMFRAIFGPIGFFLVYLQFLTFTSVSAGKESNGNLKNIPKSFWISFEPYLILGSLGACGVLSLAALILFDSSTEAMMLSMIPSVLFYAIYRAFAQYMGPTLQAVDSGLFFYLVLCVEILVLSGCVYFASILGEITFYVITLLPLVLFLFNRHLVVSMKLS